MMIDFPAPGPLTFSPEERQALVALTYRRPVEITWGECDDGDEWVSLSPTGLWRDQGATALLSPVAGGWCLTDASGMEQWTVRTVTEAVERLSALL
jgi:hypothetical protein